MPSPTLKTAPYLSLLPQEVTAAVSRLEWLARAKMLGMVTGRHTSPHKGASSEFAEHRAYVSGDDLRNLDWRLYARSNRYYVKQYVEETNLRATIVLDVSGSMGYKGDLGYELNGERTSKFTYARYLAATLAHFLQRQQDAVGIVAFDKAIRILLRSSLAPSQTRRILEELYKIEPVDETELGPVLHEVAERAPKRGSVMIISDLLGDLESLVSALHHFRFRGNEITVFHIMAEEELTFPFRKGSHFLNLEDAEHSLPIDPSSIRAQYLAQVQAHLDGLKKACGKAGADYRLLSTKDPFQESLAEFLAQRRLRRFRRA